MEVKEIHYKLQELRRKWTEEPEHRKILELQAKLLKKALVLKEPQPTLIK